MSTRKRPTAFDISFGGTASHGESVSLRDSSREASTSSNSPFAQKKQDPKPKTSALRPLGSSSHTPPDVKPAGAAARRWSSCVQPPMARPPDSFSSTSTAMGRSEAPVDKRKSVHDAGSAPPGKRRKFADDVDSRAYIDETKNTLLMGEDPREDLSEDDIPIRFLTDFYLYDPQRSGEYITLADLPNSDKPGSKTRFKAIGNVAPVYEEEEAGQEDDYEDGNGSGEMQKLRTSAIESFVVNYAEAKGAVYIKTAHAWYMLGTPVGRYKETYMASYRPHRMAQLLVYRACELTQEGEEDAKDYDVFLEDHLGLYDELAEIRITGALLKEAATIVFDLLRDGDLSEALSSVPIREYLSAAGYSREEQARQRKVTHAKQTRFAKSRTYKGNIDLDVLRPEQQNRTYVTPFVEHLSKGLFREKLRVAGRYRGPKVDQRVEFKNKQKRRDRLMRWLKQAHADKHLEFRRDERLGGEYWKSVYVSGVKYEIGDCAMLPVKPKYDGRLSYPVPNVVDDETVPQHHTLAEYFWFGKIISINQRTKEMHVQWFEHASKTCLQEIHDPQQLFISECCSNEPLEAIVGKVDVEYWYTHTEYRDQRPTLNHMTFFCSGLAFNPRDGSFYTPRPPPDLGSRPPDNCYLCFKFAEEDSAQRGQHIPMRGHPGKIFGVAIGGRTYHHHDYVLIREPGKAVCRIGQILQFKDKSHECRLVVRLLGRINDIREKICPEELKNEHHLFLTDMVKDIKAEDIIGPCRVMNANELSSRDLAAWLDEAKRHFFVRYHFPELDVKDPDTCMVLSGDNAKQVLVCSECYGEDDKQRLLRQQFAEAHPSQRKLRAFDPFAGVGALGLSMQQAGCLELTHAIEISPSAAKTLRENSPDTKVYNQCSNVVLEYAYKHVKKIADLKVPKDVEQKHALPSPPSPRDVDCIVAGFPCQPHSRLNMYQRANDRKSHLILNLLSFVDFMDPKYCFFENVRGFLNFNLNAVQLNKYQTTGGIDMGGLKFLVRALIAMGYQVRYGLLQGAHYGLPQTRVRFFLVAAKYNLVLPELPQPLYAFPLKDSLEIKFPYGLRLSPIDTSSGKALFNYVSIDDAISDLPRFDWRNPRNRTESPRRDRETHRDIPLVSCRREESFCGFERSTYHHEPRTLFQQMVRQTLNSGASSSGSTEVAQHFTRVLKEDVVTRVVYIPLRPKADYRDLFDAPYRDLWEWQFADPKSATARLGYRPGMYGRPDKDGWFQTTVTNMEPTAKQSWVLHPYCKRTVTVRELARSQGFPDHFKFYSVAGEVVKTMHRQIGNAVPWPIGLALGRELREAMFKYWLENHKDTTVIVE